MRNTAKTIVEVLQKAGYKAFFVGGCVRDLLLNKEPKDYDIATSAYSEEIEALFAETYAVGKSFGVITVMEGGHHFEVATFRSDAGASDGRRPNAVFFTHEADDAMRRDFTINGLFLDPITNEVQDFVGGRSDLSAKLIRFIGNPEERIVEDHLRILRAVRFKTTLGFNYHSSTREALLKQAALATKVSAERLRDEWHKMMEGAGAREALEDLEALGLLQAILPELTERLAGPGREAFLEAWGSWPASTARPLRWAFLLTQLNDPYQEAAPLLQRFRLSRYETEAALFLLRHYARWQELARAPLGQLRRFLLHPHVPLLLQWWAKDHGRHPDLQHLLQEVASLREHFVDLPKPLVTGHEMQSILGISKGPDIGRMHNELVEKQLTHEIQSKEEALEWLKSLKPGA